MGEAVKGCKSAAGIVSGIIGKRSVLHRGDLYSSNHVDTYTHDDTHDEGRRSMMKHFRPTKVDLQRRLESVHTCEKQLQATWSCLMPQAAALWLHHRLCARED
jgi:hypothetical protein